MRMSEAMQSMMPRITGTALVAVTADSPGICREDAVRGLSAMMIVVAAVWGGTTGAGSRAREQAAGYCVDAIIDGDQCIGCPARRGRRPAHGVSSQVQR